MASNEIHAAGAPLLPLIDLNQDRREERQGVLQRSRRHSAAVLATVALALLVPLPLTIQALALRGECQKAQRQASGVRQRLQAMTDSDAELDAKISRWTRLLHSQQARQAWGVTFSAFAACLPGDVSLQEVQISSKGSGAQVQLQGSAETMAGLRAFTDALARSTVFARLHLDETTVGSGSVTFRMAGPLSGALAKAPASSAP